VAQTSLNCRSRLLPTRTNLCKEPTEIFASRNPSSALLRTYQNIISHEITENTNKPLIKELKDYRMVGTSGAFSLSVAGHLRFAFGRETI
jgi:hypothetical protein